MTKFFTLETIMSFLSGVVVPLAAAFIRQKVNNEKTRKEDKLSKEIHASINVINKLDSLRDEFGADRVWIDQFHNGGHYYPTGKSIQKFSLFHESVAQGVSSTKMLFQNIPVSLFSQSMNRILETNVVSIPDFKDDTVATYGLKYTAAETGCKSLYVVGIKDINNKIIGLLGVEYVKRKKLLEPEDLQSLEIEAAQIGGVIYNHLCEK